MAGQPDPKPGKRKRKPIRVIDAKATTRAVLREPSCAICHRPSATGHHVLARGGPYFGDDLPENIVALCGSGTTGCHGAVEAADVFARGQLGVYLIEERPDVVSYLQGKLGPSAASEWLLRHLRVVSPS